MSWNQVKADWSDSEVIPAIRYPSTWINSDDESVDYVFTTIESFNPRKETPGDIMDSLNNHNMGNIEMPARYTIDIVTFPRGKGYDLLNKCQNGRRYFDLVLMQADSFDSNLTPNTNVGKPTGVWNHIRTVFKACKVRSSDERYAVGAKPTVTFNCTALRYVFDQGLDGGVDLGDGIISVTKDDATHRITDIQE